MNVERRTSNFKLRTPGGAGRHQPPFIKMGILGGAFDPVHNGHLAMARAAMTECGLTEVIFVPAAISPYKTGEPIASERDRVAMLCQAIADQPAYSVSEMELDRGGISYTIETVQQLQRECDPEAEIFLIIGMDNLLGIAGWERIESLIEICHFIVLKRPEFELEQLGGENRYWAERIMDRVRGQIISLSVPVSSTVIRAAAREGRDLSAWVPPGVAAYIKENRLYI